MTPPTSPKRTLSAQMAAMLPPRRTADAPSETWIARQLELASLDRNRIYTLTPEDLNHTITSDKKGLPAPLGKTKVRRFGTYDTAATTRLWLKALVTTTYAPKKYIWPHLRKHRLLITTVGTNGTFYLYHQEGRASFQVRASILLTRYTYYNLHSGALIYFPELRMPPSKKRSRAVPPDLTGGPTGKAVDTP